MKMEENSSDEVDEVSSLPILNTDSDSDSSDDDQDFQNGKIDLIGKFRTSNEKKVVASTTSVETKRKFYTQKKVRSLPLSTQFSTMTEGLRYDISKEYNVERQLGVGTYASVRLAQHLETKNYVAIKMARGATSIGLLKNEANILKMLDSEFFPKFYDFIVDSIGNKAYLVMEYVNGQQLDEFSKSRDGLDEKKAKEFLKQISEAVAFMHSKGVAHRDIKPQNIIVTHESKIKIIDFNISKVSESLVHPKLCESSCKFYGKFFTQISSPLFAAPELSSLEYYTESIDIWGIGVLYLILLCGIDDFNANVTARVQKDEILSSLDESLNRHSDASKLLLAKLLSPVANDRPSIEELMALLDE